LLLAESRYGRRLKKTFHPNTPERPNGPTENA
jgi:hypothetical protein